MFFLFSFFLAFKGTIAEAFTYSHILFLRLAKQESTTFAGVRLTDLVTRSLQFSVILENAPENLHAARQWRPRRVTRAMPPLAVLVRNALQSLVFLMAFARHLGVAQRAKSLLGSAGLSISIYQGASLGSIYSRPPFDYGSVRPSVSSSGFKELQRDRIQSGGVHLALN